MTNKRKLGRGLDALLGIGPNSISGDVAEGTAVTVASEQSQDSQLRQLPIEFLQRGKYQPRRDMHPEALEELSESIRAQGIMQPIVVRPIGGDRYEIIAGERRWRAAQMAELQSVPALVRDVPDEAAIAMALIENIQREDLNPIEEANALARLQKEFTLTQEQIARAVGKSRATVANLMRLLSLEADVRTMLEHGDLEMGHARALLGLSGSQQVTVARTVVGKGMTVRQTEALIRRIQQQADKPVTSAAAISPDIRQLQDKISDHVGVPVLLQHSAKGKGKLVFSYSSVDELEGILDHLKLER